MKPARFDHITFAPMLLPYGRLKPHLPHLLLLLLLPFAWWWPLLTGRLPDYMDTVTYLFPLRTAVAHQLRSGCLPLWLPEIFCGTPLAANPQVAAFYPPQLLFYLFPTAIGFGILAILHYCLAGIGAYALVYSITRSRGSALLAGLIFQFGSMMIGRIALLPHVYACAWVPWIFLSAEQSLARTGKLERADLGLAALLAVQFLAGAPQISYYTGLALIVLWLTRGLQRPRLIGWFVLRGGFAVLLAAALAAIQLLPTHEFLSLVRRNEIPLRDLVTQSLNGPFIWKSLLGFTIAQGEDIDSINAVGILPYLLSISCLIFRRYRSTAAPYLCASVLGWLLSMGALMPFWVHVLPGLDRFHAPRRALMIWSMLLPIATGLGFAQFLEVVRERNWSRAYGPVVFFVSLLSAIWILPRLERVFCRPEHLYADRQYIRAIDNSRFLTVDPTLNYSYDSRRADYGKSLVPNGAVLSGVQDSQGYDPLMLESIARFRDASCRTTGILYPGHAVYFSNPSSPALRLLGVQYLVGRHDAYDPSRVVPGAYLDHAALSQQLELMVPDERWPLYRYIEERKLAWTVSEVIPVSSFINPASFWLSADLYNSALVRSGFDQPANIHRRDVRFDWITSRSIQLSFDTSATSKANCFACVSVPYVPGWHAVDNTGQELPVYCADELILGLKVPPEVKRVTLTYSPRSFYQGAIITLAGLLLTTAFFVRLRKVSSV